MYSQLLDALAIALVLEGILPFLSPKSYRSMLLNFMKQSDTVIRVIGLVLMLCGVLILYA